MVAYIKKNLMGIGMLILFFGFVLLYLARYGHNVTYTHTYYYVAQFVPPFVDVWALMIGMMFLLQLVFIACGGYQAIKGLQSRKWLRIVVGITGTILVVSTIPWLINWLVIDRVIHNRVVLFALSNLTQIGALIFFGSLGLLALGFATFPHVVSKYIDAKPGLTSRLIALGIALVLFVFLILMIELLITDPPHQQVLAPQSSSLPSSSDATHYLFFTVDPRPERLRPGQSTPIELIFKALDQSKMSAGARGAYPIVLDPNHDYAVSVSVRAVGFDAQGPADELLEPRLLVPGEPLRWVWIVSPKGDTAGTKQVILFDAYIHDLTSGRLVAESPYTTVSIEVSTPLGLPTWLVSPQTGLGAIIGGVVAIVVPWALQEISTVKKEQREEERKQREREAQRSSRPWWQFWNRK